MCLPGKEIDHQRFVTSTMNVIVAGLCFFFISDNNLSMGGTNEKKNIF